MLWEGEEGGDGEPNVAIAGGYKFRGRFRTRGAENPSTDELLTAVARARVEEAEQAGRR